MLLVKMRKAALLFTIIIHFCHSPKLRHETHAPVWGQFVLVLQVFLLSGSIEGLRQERVHLKGGGGGQPCFPFSLWLVRPPLETS